MILYTIGDSFTYGEELDNPKLYSWPALISQRFGFNLINEAKPGVGNEFIIKKTILALEKHQPNLVIVGWTSCARQEYADSHGVYDIWPAHNRRKFSNNNLGFRLPLIDYITRHNNDLHEYRGWLRQIVLLQSFFQANKQDYLMVSTHDNQSRFAQFYTVCQDYYDLIDHTKFVGWPSFGMVEWSYGTAHAVNGHPLEDGHRKIADEISQHI